MASGTTQRVGVLGASSFVGTSLLQRLVEQGIACLAVSRRQTEALSPLITWTTAQNLTVNDHAVTQWISLAPLWITAEHADLMRKAGLRRLVALSSTSVITKAKSSSPFEQALIQRLKEAEDRLQSWAFQNDVELIILRATLIYGRGQDKNLSEIARLIRKTRIFPLLGPAAGKRQPVHVDDVAQACLSALQQLSASRKLYVISGAEVLPYHEMVRRIFVALSLRPIFIRIPARIFEWAVRGMNLIPRYRNWTPAMAERMNMDMAFSHEEAARDFGFAPRAFTLTREDLP